MRFRLILAVLIALLLLVPVVTSVQGEEEQVPEPDLYDLLSYGNHLPVEPPEPLWVDTQYGYLAENVVDEYLQEQLDGAESGEELEIIVQFLDTVEARDLRRLRELGFVIEREYRSLPAVHCIGSKEAIEVLSQNERVFWIEFNEEMVFNMQGTTTIINATKVWNSNVLNFNGQDEGRIDGTGVTVVVLDTGIDAGHPDLDYKEKTIMNLKSDRGAEPWIEMENSDTGCGHGTHCAGTVAGNGEASGGAKRGVAPGANLIGLCTGEYMLTGVVGALEWTYEHSRPGNNPYNIRAVSNSWGSGGGKYDPQDTISQLSEKIVYENNVNVVFAAGNSGGDGSDIQSSNYGNAPANLCVAALEHEGDGVASFSSRGQKDLNGTWPDIGAPGVKIWSTAARRTIISFMLKKNNPTNFNPYYFAISGTSMATPHISGICALLWQAYPGLKTSYVHDDYNGDDIPDFFNLTTTRVHEAELILEASAKYLLPGADNGVPTDINATGWTGKSYDYAQGYGMAMTDRAVAIALVLRELRTRDFDSDGDPDYPNATVADAVKQYREITVTRTVTQSTNTLETEWKGEWCKFNNQTSNFQPYYTDESHYLYIPPDAQTLKLMLDYSTFQTSRPQVGTLRLVIDWDGDANPDWTQSQNMDEHKESEIDIASSGQAGKVWVVNIEGHGVIAPLLNYFQTNQYYEARIEYTVGAVLTFDQGSSFNSTLDFYDPHAAVGQWEFGEPADGYTNGTVTKDCNFYDLAMVMDPKPVPEDEKPEEKALWPWILLILAVIAAAIIVFYIYMKKKKKD
jgi:serine protease AprX